jgi:multiple sugar transport system ATP-binding protein
VAEIQINNLHKSFTDFVAVRNSTLRLEDGKFVVLLGPSGCGKTTTLRMIAGLEYPTSGQITLDGKDVTYLRPRERDIAMVFQLFALYPHMGVRENLTFPLRNEGLPKAEIDRRIKEVASILRIEHLLDSRLSSLAGGDRQRLALGRAIVRQPKAFLMDEPLGTLDAEFRELMCVELRKLHDRLKTTTVFVTHDQNEAMALADHIVVMNQGDILQADAPEGIYNFPSSVFVAQFIGRPPMNLLPVPQGLQAGASNIMLANTSINIPLSQESAESALLGIRPEHVTLSNQADQLEGTITYVEYFGSHWIVAVNTAAGLVKAMVSKAVRPTEGDSVSVSFKSERVVLFNASTERLMASDTTTAYQRSMTHG